MDIQQLIFACVVYYIAGIISVSVGGTSLITVPILVSLGMDPKTAIATNMFALIFVSISGAVGFKEKIDIKHARFIGVLTILTILGSWWGANILIGFDESVLEKFLAVIICVFLPIFIFKKDLGIVKQDDKNSLVRFLVAGVFVFALGVYGGFFSGGYVLLLSYVLILGLGFDFLEAAGITKILNIFSSIVACIIFFRYGLIDFKVAVPLAIVIFFGGFSGAKLAIQKGNVWVRNLFVIMGICLAIKLLVFP